LNFNQSGIKNRATAVLCTTGDDVVNVYITFDQSVSKSGYPDHFPAQIIRHNVKKFYQAGADNLYSAFEIAAMAVANILSTCRF